LDPVTLEVLWSRLIAVVNEQAAALMRTSFTPVVREAGDLAASLFDPQGNMIAQAVTGTPGHINAIATGMRHILAAYPAGTVRPGDVLITNDPWFTSGQLNDLTVVTPVFKGDRLVAFFGNCCHHYDIGGRIRSAEARDVHEEGLYIPVLKMYEAGEPNRTFFSLIEANVRHPDLMAGDIHAQVAGNDVGSRSLLGILDEFGLPSVEPIGDEIIRRSEEAMRASIREVPDGSYENEVWIDGYEEPLRLTLRLEVRGDEILVDYAGSSPQSRYGINVVLNYTHAYTTYALKCAICPDVPNNEGSFRPVKVTAPPGSILNAEKPAPVSGRSTVGHFVPGLILGALAQAIPDRVLAEGSGSLWIIHTNAINSRGQRRTYTMLPVGGTGARPTKDGLSATAFPSGVIGVSAEVVESVSPLMLRKKELRRDSGGPGKHRGGLGQTVAVRVRTREPYIIAPMTERLRFPARGYLGGESGAAGEVFLSTGERITSKQQIVLPAETEITFHLPGGGGYGDPLERDPALVLSDVDNGLVSPERARDDYGVVVDLERGLVDHAATQTLRHSMKAARRPRER
jgi:N-methylhydantoinase B